MQEHAKKWVTRLSTVQNSHDAIDFQTHFVADLSEDVGYPSDVIKARDLLHKWADQKNDNIVAYRDQTYASIYTGTMSPSSSTTWWEAFDDSVEAFTSL
jgi:trimethylamine monooxygenase